MSDLDYFLKQFHRSTDAEVTTEAQEKLPAIPLSEVPLRPCDFNDAHPAYAAVWLPGNRTRAGRWDACPLCKQEWDEQWRRDQRLLNMLPG